MSLQEAAETLAWYIKNSSITRKGNLVALSILWHPPINNLATTPFWRIIDAALQEQPSTKTVPCRLTKTITFWVTAQERKGRHFTDIGQEIIEVLRQHGVKIPRIKEFELSSNEARHILPNSGAVTTYHKKPV